MSNCSSEWIEFCGWLCTQNAVVAPIAYSENRLKACTTHVLLNSPNSGLTVVSQGDIPNLNKARAVGSFSSIPFRRRTWSDHFSCLWKNVESRSTLRQSLPTAAFETPSNHLIFATYQRWWLWKPSIRFVSSTHSIQVLYPHIRTRRIAALWMHNFVRRLI